MNITYKSKKIEKVCTDAKISDRKYGNSRLSLEIVNEGGNGRRNPHIHIAVCGDGNYGGGTY